MKRRIKLEELFEYTRERIIPPPPMLIASYLPEQLQTQYTDDRNYIQIDNYLFNKYGSLSTLKKYEPTMFPEGIGSAWVDYQSIMIGTLLANKYKYDTLAGTLDLEYNPIWNVDGTEVVTHNSEIENTTTYGEKAITNVNGERVQATEYDDIATTMVNGARNETTTNGAIETTRDYGEREESTEYGQNQKTNVYGARSTSNTVGQIQVTNQYGTAEHQKKEYVSPFEEEVTVEVYTNKTVDTDATKTDTSTTGSHTDTSTAQTYTDTEQYGTHTDTTTKETYQDTETVGTHTDTVSANSYTDTNTIAGRTDTITNDEYTDTSTTGEHTDNGVQKLTEKTTTERGGNIGVTSTQSLIEQERQVALFNLFDIIFNDFLDGFCLQIIE